MSFKTVTGSLLFAAVASAETEQLRQSPTVGTTWSDASPWGIVDFSIGVAMGAYDIILSHHDYGCYSSAYNSAITLISASNYAVTGNSSQDWYDEIQFYLTIFGGVTQARDTFFTCTEQLQYAKEKYAKYDKEETEEGEKDIIEEAEMLFSTYGASPRVEQTSYWDQPYGKLTAEAITIGVYTLLTRVIYGSYPRGVTYFIDAYSTFVSLAETVEYFANPEYYFLQDGISVGHALTEFAFMSMKYYNHFNGAALDLDEHEPLWFLKPKNAVEHHDHSGEEAEAEEAVAEEEVVAE